MLAGRQPRGLELIILAIRKRSRDWDAFQHLPAFLSLTERAPLCVARTSGKMILVPRDEPGLHDGCS